MEGGISAALATAQLGLSRSAVSLAESANSWGQAYRAIEPELRAACGESAIAIEHVGSTAVPGLRAKPILDVAIGAQPDAAVPDALVDALVGLGFIDRGVGAGSIGRLLVWEVQPGVRAVHVHIVGYGTREWNDYVEFREALRADASLVQEYERIKNELAQRFPGDRTAYTLGKARFVEQTLRHAGSKSAAAR